MDRTADLSEVLSDLGVDVHRVQNDEINGRCPVHHLTKGRESTRYSWYINSETGLWYCFSCGARGNLSHLISQLTDDPSALWGIQSHLITSGLQRLTADEQEVHEKRPHVDWGQYSRFQPLGDGMLRHRRLDEEVARRYGIKWDPERKAVVIPIVSPLGELWGWQLKKTGWVRNHPEGVHKGDTLFGIERAFGSIALLLESPLDVVRFHSVYGGSDISAIASFGANISVKQINLLSDRFDGVIIALDNDQAGHIETKRLTRSLASFRRGTRYWKYCDNVKDLGDMTDGQIIKGIASVTSVYV
jgi:5S rRNA maturation endonuclease (ribonuclease M5)